MIRFHIYTFLNPLSLGGLGIVLQVQFFSTSLDRAQNSIRTNN
jgi:hypothetical protein